MSLSRRDFLRYGMAAASTAVASGAIDLSPVEAAATSLRIKEAKAFPGVCPYCADGCAQLIYVKDGKIVDIEGDPDAPHTEGALCPKGSSTYQLSLNERRITKRSEEHTSELQSLAYLVCRLLLEKKKNKRVE